MSSTTIYDEPLNDEERAVIRAFRRLAKKWPKSLWVFGCESGLVVMRTGPDGHHIHDASGCVDQDYIVERIRGIDADGGAW